MTAKAAGDTAAVLAAFDFSQLSRIADIGGGRGHLLRAVLESAPDTEGILFDLPGVIDTVDAPERCTVHASDVFFDPLPAVDVYILMEVIHDWDDNQAAAILSAVRCVATPGATVLIIEAVADEEVLDPIVRTLDMIMLAITGGRERTAAELDELLANADFHTTGSRPTPIRPSRR